MCVYPSTIPNTFIYVMKTTDRELAASGTFFSQSSTSCYHPADIWRNNNVIIS